MILARSDILEADEVDQTSPGGPSPTLVSWHFIRTALRRRWIVCAMSAMLGLLAAVAYLVAFPAAHTAKATLFLAHDSSADPSRAMSTDVSLLRTRIVATRTVDRLGLTMTPDGFLNSVSAEPVSTELLSLTVSAPTGAEAVRRLSALSSIYLDFRASQLSTQSSVLVDGINQRIERLESEVADVSRRIESLPSTGNPDSLSEAVAHRAYLRGQIDTLRQSIEDATLQNQTMVSLSRVIDPETPDSAGFKRRLALTLASGFIGGAAFGCGTVLFFAIASDRLRRRSDVAAALQAQVAISVGRIAPFPKRWLWLPRLRLLDERRADERQRLARAIETELPLPGQSDRVAVVCIDNADEVRFAVAHAAADLAAGGCSVAVIDLTEKGSVNPPTTRSISGSTDAPVLLRPRGIPALARGPEDLRLVGQDGKNRPTFESVDVKLVLADLDPSVGADHIKTWTDRVVIAVTAGRSSAELVRTAADLVRTAGLELRFAALLHTERTDDSSGTAGFDRLRPIHIADEQDKSASARGFSNEQGTVEEHTGAADMGVAALLDPVAVRDAAVEQSAGEEQPVDEELIAEHPTLYDAPTVREERARTDQVQDGDDGPTVEMPAISGLDPTTTEDRAAAERKQAAVNEEATDDVEKADEVASYPEKTAGTNGRQHSFGESPLVPVGGPDAESNSGRDSDLNSSEPNNDASAMDADDQVLFEPDHVPTQPDDRAVDRWYLYAEDYPPDWRWHLYLEAYPEAQPSPLSTSERAESGSWELHDQQANEDSVADVEGDSQFVKGEVPSNGQASNGQGRHRTRTRTRAQRKRNRLSRPHSGGD